MMRVWRPALVAPLDGTLTMSGTRTASSKSVNLCQELFVAKAGV